MSRPKKVSLERKIELMAGYILDELHGDPNKVKFTDAARYAQGKGENIAEHVFRNDPDVQQYLDRLKHGQPITLGDTEVLPPYVPLKMDDICAVLRKDPESIQRLVLELDGKCSQYAEKVSSLQARLSVVQNENLMLKQDKAIRTQEKATHSTYTFHEDPRFHEVLEERNALLDANAGLHRFISDAVMQDVALLLLEERRISAGSIHFLNHDAYVKMSVVVPTSLPENDAKVTPDTDAKKVDTDLNEETPVTMHDNAACKEARLRNASKVSAGQHRKTEEPFNEDDDDFEQISMDDVLSQMKELYAMCEEVKDEL